MPAAPSPVSFPIYGFQVSPVEFYGLYADNLQLGATDGTHDKFAFYGPRFQFDRVLTVYAKHGDHSNSPSADRVLSIIATIDRRNPTSPTSQLFSGSGCLTQDGRAGGLKSRALCCQKHRGLLRTVSQQAGTRPG
jgi:hypothetical protein